MFCLLFTKNPPGFPLKPLTFPPSGGLKETFGHCDSGERKGIQLKKDGFFDPELFKLGESGNDLPTPTNKVSLTPTDGREIISCFRFPRDRPLSISVMTPALIYQTGCLSCKIHAGVFMALDVQYWNISVLNFTLHHSSSQTAL